MKFSLRINSVHVLAVVVCLAALICASCATQVVLKKAGKLESEGRYGEAYTNIVQALQGHPTSKDLMSEKERVGALFTAQLLRDEGQTATNNLIRRIQLLETAGSIGVTNQGEIAVSLDRLRSLRKSLSAQADDLTNSTDLAVMVQTAKSLLVYADVDSDLRDKVQSPSAADHAEKLLLQLVAANDLRRARSCGKNAQDVWGISEITGIVVGVEADLLRSCLRSLVPESSQDQSLGNKTVRRLIDVLFNPGDIAALDAYQKDRNALTKADLPDAKVFLLGALSKQESNYFHADIVPATVFGRDHYISVSGTNCADFLVEFNVTDAAYGLKTEDHAVYSRYYAGDTQVHNPDYDRIAVAYQQAQSAQMSANYAQQVNPNVVNMIIAIKTAKNANEIATLLANTPRYNSVPVYQDYELKQRDVTTVCHFQAELAVVDSGDGSNVWSQIIDTNRSYAFKETIGAHPQDHDGYRNEAMPAGWAESCLEKCVASELNGAVSSLSDGYTMATVHKIVEIQKGGRDAAAVEMALALAFQTEGSQPIGEGKVGGWRSEPGMVALQHEVERLAFDHEKAPSLDLGSNIVRQVMLRLGSLLGAQSSEVRDEVANANPLEFRQSETQMPRPTNTAVMASIFSGQIKNSPSGAHVNAKIKPAFEATVTVYTDQGSGSGFVISTNGYLVTNHHVVQGASRVLVAGQDGRKITAEIVESNAARDLAILKVSGRDWTPVQLGDMDSVGVGDNVYAIGSPGGIDTVLEFTATRGIVSSIREFPSPANPNVQVQYIQTDAAINSGNSGGPLLNDAGKVIGINSEKIVGVGKQGLGFAISVDELKKLYFRYLNN